MSTLTTRIGHQLWSLLPEVYRHRDTSGALAATLDAWGELFDPFYATLEQRLADSFPDTATDGPSTQDWILPYLADLVDARLLSPHAEGRRREVAGAVRWRQRKGTLPVVEEIAEAVGQTNVETQEGWRRVTVTPRLDVPMSPAPLVTPDLRDLPPPPGSSSDISRRTVDLRTPDLGQGIFHPRRLLLFVPPPTGFFSLDTPRRLWWQAHEGGHLEIDPETGRYSGIPERGSLLVIEAPFPDVLADHRSARLEDLAVLDRVVSRGERLELRRVAIRHLEVEGKGALLDATDCLFETVTVNGGTARLEHSTVLGPTDCARLQASDCLFAGPVTLADAATDTANDTANDTVGTAPTRADLPTSCIRYSRIPRGLAPAPGSGVRWPANTHDLPVFFDFELRDPDGTLHRSTEFGRPGCGVLHPACPDSLRFGAEDGGEMGAYHHLRHTLQQAAVLAKLEDFLPIGIEAVLLPDAELLDIATPKPPSDPRDDEVVS